MVFFCIEYLDMKLATTIREGGRAERGNRIGRREGFVSILFLCGKAPSDSMRADNGKRNVWSTGYTLYLINAFPARTGPWQGEFHFQIQLKGEAMRGSLPIHMNASQISNTSFITHQPHHTSHHIYDYSYSTMTIVVVIADTTIHTYHPVRASPLYRSQSGHHLTFTAH